MSKRGVTLPETIVSMALLALCILMVSRLFQRASRENVRNTSLRRSVALAEATTDRIRDWAVDPANFTSDWSTYDGMVQTDPAYPGLQARVDVSKTQKVFSPCLREESRYPGSERTMTQSTVTVRVRAGVNPDQPGQYVEIVTVIGSPARRSISLSVDRSGGPPDPVPPDGIVDLEARAVDGDGFTLNDLCYRWRLIPLTSDATLTGVSRDGRRAQVKNGFYRSGAWVHVAGTVQVQIEARYHGRIIQKNSSVILLQ